MGKYEKLLIAIISGKSDHSIRFSELIHLLCAMGFNLRINGDHHILYKNGIEEILNLQPKGSQAKAYQVKQIRNLIIKYQLEDPQ